MIKPLSIFLLLALACISFSHAQELAAYKAELFISKGDTLPYRILYPQNFDESRKYPYLLLLHGAGERGRDNLAQLAHGSRLFAGDDFRTSYPAIVVFPQCPPESYWANVTVERDTMPFQFDFKTGGAPTKAMRLLLELVEEQTSRPYIDPQRLYVGGLSMGGMGTLELLRRKPGSFAAALAICGGDHPANAKKYADNTSIWLFHGTADNVVPVTYSRQLADTLKALEADMRYTEYPGVKHDSWDHAFAEPELAPWLFSKKK